MKKILSDIILWLGIALIAAAIILVVLSVINQNNATEQMSRSVDELYSLMPETHTGFLDNRADTNMATVQLNNVDYIGIIEIPLYQSVFPVAYTASKENMKYQPCRYSGSIYSQDLIIGGAATQMTFSDFISKGDEICLTDMTGAKFTYSVDSIKIEKNFSPKSLSDNDYDLILYIKDSYSTEYTVIFCKL